MLSNRDKWPELIPLRFGSLEINFPHFKDPRYLIWICQVSFFFLASLFANLYRPMSYMALLSSFFTAAFLDLALLKRKTGKWIFPQSGLITGSGLALLLESRLMIIYMLAAVAGILSKHLFQYQGRHVFNPATYGLLFVTSVFPESAVTFAGQWGAMWWITAIVYFFGVIVAYRSRVLDVASFWIGGFVLVAFIRHFFFGASLWMALGPATGAGFALFSFYMVTDPRTIPSSRKARLIFCLLAAGIDGFFRLQFNHYSMFWAIFIVYLLFILMEEVGQWKTAHIS